MSQVKCTRFPGGSGSQQGTTSKYIFASQKNTKSRVTSRQTIYSQPTYTKKAACIEILPQEITYCTWHLFKYFKTQPNKTNAKEIVLYQNTCERYSDIQE
jgi:hypothetical protein